MEVNNLRNKFSPPPLPLPEPKDFGVALVMELIAPIMQACKPHIQAETLPEVYANMLASILGLMVHDLGQEAAREVLRHMYLLLMAQELERGRMQ
jgi:hypothetical protein